MALGWAIVGAGVSEVPSVTVGEPVSGVFIDGLGVASPPPMVGELSVGDDGDTGASTVSVGAGVETVGTGVASGGCGRGADGGGVGDGDEVANGTDPLDPSDDLVEDTGVIVDTGGINLDGRTGEYLGGCGASSKSGAVVLGLLAGLLGLRRRRR